MTKEQASAELFSRNIGLDNALQSFMNQLISSFPYIVLNYTMDKYDNTVFIPQLVQMEEEVAKSNIPRSKELTTLIKELEVTGLSNTIDIEKSYIYNQVNLIISEDYKIELFNRKTIQEAFKVATKTYIESVKTKILRSDEFIEQAIIIRDEVRTAQETALLADTGLNKVQPILPAPVKEEKLLGIDVSEQQVAYEADPNKEIKMPSVSVDPDHVKKVIVDLFNKMVDMELQKSNFTPQVDKSIYLTKTTIKLALENAIFRIKPPATVEEKIKQMQSLSIIASNFGNPVAIDFETVLYDIASEMDLSALIRTPEAQRQYLVNKVVGNVSLSVVATPEQAPQVLEQAFNMKVDPVQQPTQSQMGQTRQQVPQQLSMEQPMQ
jgi:hypothetical protein